MTMRLNRPLLRLNRSFCADTLAAEVAALPATAWIPHPGNYRGNDAVPLVTPGGRISNDFVGAMMPTEHLRASPYIMEVMAALGAVWGRGRLMGLAPGAEVPSHVDLRYYWRTHFRVHIPVITNPEVRFHCGGESVHMDPGEVWVFDSFRMHRVHNGGTEKRVHLVLDTVGGDGLWDLIEEAEALDAAHPPQVVARGSARADALSFETVNAPRIMSPWEIRCHVAFLAEHARPHPRRDAIFRRLDKFAFAWASIWAQHGDGDAGLPAYRELLGTVQRDLPRLSPDPVVLDNDVPLLSAIGELIYMVALPPAAAGAAPPARRWA
jgi:hypothetical protein